MPFLRPINLPPHLYPQSLTVLGLGIYITIFRYPPFGPPASRELPVLPARPTNRRIADTLSIWGITSTALMLPYFLNSYMPIEENQWLHVSVPIRLGVAAAMLATVAVHGREGMSQEGFWEFLGLAIFDGAAATYLGFQLGRFDGIVPRYDGLVRASVEGKWVLPLAPVNGP